MQFDRGVVAVGVVKKYILTVLFSVLAILCLHLSDGNAAFICTSDLNNNGNTGDKGELQECWVTEELTQLCPIETAGCTATYVPTICTNGGTLNVATDQCEAAGGANCPTGYVYDLVEDTCTAPPDCSGGLLDTAQDVCWQDIQCPANFTYSSVSGVCTKAPSCPPGGSYDGATDRCKAPVPVNCPTGYISGQWPYAANPEICARRACPTGSYELEFADGTILCRSRFDPAPECPANTAYEELIDPVIYWQTNGYCTSHRTFCAEGNYNSGTGNCELTLSTNAPPAGYVYDPVTGAYYGDPACPVGTIYNAVNDRCEANVTYACPAGYTHNNSYPYNRCEIEKCPNGVLVLYSGAGYEQCEIAPPPITCPVGFTYLGGKCLIDATCPVDSTFDNISKKCIYNAQYGCSTGYTFNVATGRCEQPPTCPAGTAYDPTIDQCAAPDPAVESCPLGNFPCDQLTGMCVNNYPCNTSFQTQAICQQNCDGTCSSVCNTDALSAFGDVFWTGSTGTAWFGITGVTGSGSDLIFYGKDASYVDMEVGRVTMNGCVFSGSASYFTDVADNCSSTAWGLSGIAATGNQLLFYGGECGVASGTIDISGCYIQVDQSIGNFDLTHVIGSGTSLTFYSGFSGNQPITTIGMCQYSWQCSTCSKTEACVYACPDTSFILSADYRCVKYATCDGSGTLSTQLDVCEEVVAITCPAGYSPVGNQCQANPQCPAGSSYDALLNKCVMTMNVTCPSRDPLLYDNPYTFDSVSGMCTAVVTCPAGSSSGGWGYPMCIISTPDTVCPTGSNFDSAAGLCTAAHTGVGTFDPVLDKYVVYYTASCPTGWTETNGVCAVAAECPAGTTWNPQLGRTRVNWQWVWEARCAVTPTYSCASGYTWSSYEYYAGYTTWGCVKSADCAAGDYVARIRAGLHYCTTSPLPADCPVNYAYDSTIFGCYTSAVCEVGVIDMTLNACTVPDSIICPFGFMSNSLTSRCEVAPLCINPGIYSNTLDTCNTQANYDCPVGYTFLNGVCYSLPNCPNGTYDSVSKQCFAGINTCTIGDFPCYTYNNSRLCSPNACADTTNPTVTSTTQSDLTSPSDDGTVDSTGSCSGQFYALSGEAGECRTVGTQTLFQNCCNSGTAMNPIFCDPGSDGAVATKATQNMCHYVGSYCSETWAIVGCVQSKKVYCCFNSQLARIINEQGRSQFASYAVNPWGTPENPRCRGFTPEELQMIDFSQIDLSEYFTSIQTNLTSDIKNNAEQRIQNFYQNVQ